MKKQLLAPHCLSSRFLCLFLESLHSQICTDRSINGTNQQNLYALLGNDVEDEEPVPAPLPKEIVKKTTSSKKADVAPASADPARAKKNKKQATGNEAALKNKNANKDVSGPTSTPSKHEKKSFDRHSRTGKTDSKKKIRQGWGGDDKRELEDEANGAGDALAEMDADAEAGAPATPAAKSLQEYLAELQKAENDLEGRKPARKANEGAEDKWSASEKIEKETASFVEGTYVKKIKQKATKEKKFLEFDSVFSDEAPKPFKKAPFAGKKGGKPSGKPGKPAAKAAKPAAAGDNDKNFPSL